MKTSARSSTLLVFGTLVVLASCSSAFRKHYQSNLGERTLEASGLRPHAGEPQIIVGGNRTDDDVHLLESGYRMVGLVFFEGTDEGTGPIEGFARELKAAVAVAYKRPSLVQYRPMRGHLRGSRHVGPPKAPPKIYEQGATFWARSAEGPALGALVRASRDEEGNVQTSGVTVFAVIRESAADRCGIRRGDTITGVGGQAVDSVATYTSSLRRSGGQNVDIEVHRDGAAVALACQLGTTIESLEGMPPE